MVVGVYGCVWALFGRGCVLVIVVCFACLFVFDVIGDCCLLRVVCCVNRLLCFWVFGLLTTRLLGVGCGCLLLGLYCCWVVWIAGG